jgi:hypothetical protein
MKILMFDFQESDAKLKMDIEILNVFKRDISDNDFAQFFESPNLAEISSELRLDAQSMNNAVDAIHSNNLQKIRTAIPVLEQEISQARQKVRP